MLSWTCELRVSSEKLSIFHRNLCENKRKKNPTERLHLSAWRMPSEQNIFQPDQKLARAAHVSSFQQYEELYKESIEQPAKFWGNIAKQFHWETPADAENFMTFNFDISKGPISIKWMEGASTNICYNLLDRNIKNGHGDKIAFFWYVLVFNISNEKEKFCRVGGKIVFQHRFSIFSFPPTRQDFTTVYRRCLLCNRLHGGIFTEAKCKEELSGDQTCLCWCWVRSDTSNSDQLIRKGQLRLATRELRSWWTVKPNTSLK